MVGCEPGRLVYLLPLREPGSELDASQASPTVGSVKRRDPASPPTN